MKDTHSPSTNQSSPKAELVPRLLRSLSKTQPIQEVTESGSRPEQTNLTPVRWMYEQKATAIGHFTRLTHRGRTLTQTEVATDNGAGTAEESSQILHTPIDIRKNDAHVDSAEADEQSPGAITSSTFSKKMQDMLYAIPSFAPSIGPRSTAAASQAETSDTTSSVTPSNFENGPLGHAWKSLWSALGRLRLPYSKPASSSEPSRDDILDCIDDNNSVMMYGPLEPDDTSEVEIARSEIVSIYGDGEEIRTPQQCFSPLPSESIDETLVGRGPRSPPPRFVSLPMESIDQILMGGGRDVCSQWKESDSEIVAGTTNMAQELPPTEPTVNQTPVKEYRVWLPSSTKISVQTMWWGFRIYLPPPVLDVLNNRQLEAAKRAAIITTALQWLMDHLPLSLLPPQMHPGVAILRHLVPYVGYMGGFIAWSWSAIRSFDKGYGVVLTATWLLPFALIPGTWEADEVPNLNTEPQPSPYGSS